MELNKEDLKEGQKVFACAYSTNNTEKSMANRKKPVLGIVEFPNNCRKDRGLFYELKKNGEIKTSCVGICSRHYANTEEESINIYNSFVQKQINMLQALIDSCDLDYIK